MDYIDRIRRAFRIVDNIKIQETENEKTTETLRITTKRYNINWDTFFPVNCYAIYPETMLKSKGYEIYREFLNNYNNLILRNLESEELKRIEEDILNLKNNCINLGESEKLNSSEKNEHKYDSKQDSCNVKDSKYPQHLYFEGLGYTKKAVIFRFTVKYDTKLSLLAEEIDRENKINNNAFFVIGDCIYYKKISDGSENMSQSLLVKKYKNIGNWQSKLGDFFKNIGEDILFFNGFCFVYITITKAFFSYIGHSQYIKFLFYKDKKVICKICCLKNAEIMMIDDPILPEKYKCICESCYNTVFLDSTGNPLFSNVKYKKMK